MIIPEITFKLKYERQAILRCPEISDTDGVLEYLVKTTYETDFLLRSPEELDKYTYENEKNYLEKIISSKNILMLLCVVDGKIAGNCQIDFMDHVKTAHRAKIGIALLSKYWNLGIGTKMFEVLIETARNREGITQLELEYIEGNDRARALYEKMGFRAVAVLPKMIKSKDGKLLSEIFMSYDL